MRSNFIQLLIVLLTCVVFSCTKKRLEDPSNYIRGKVVIKNDDSLELTTVDKTKLTIKLAVDNSKNEFLYSVFPDAEGYFVFKLPVNDLKDTYYVFSEYQSPDNVVYSGLKECDNVNDEGFSQEVFELRPDTTKQNYISLRVADHSNQNIGNCTLYFYTNSVAATNSFTSSPTFTVSSDVNGYYKKYNFTAGTFYVNAYKDFGSGLILKRQAKLLHVGSMGNVRDSMTLF